MNRLEVMEQLRQALWSLSIGEHGREFDLVRDVDVSGVSGTGVVADGIDYGFCVIIVWHGERSSTVIWSSIEDALAVHGHDGATKVRYRDTGEAHDEDVRDAAEG